MIADAPLSHDEDGVAGRPWCLGSLVSSSACPGPGLSPLSPCWLGHGTGLDPCERSGGCSGQSFSLSRGPSPVLFLCQGSWHVVTVPGTQSILSMGSTEKCVCTIQFPVMAPVTRCPLSARRSPCWVTPGKSGYPHHRRRVSKGTGTHQRVTDYSQSLSDSLSRGSSLLARVDNRVLPVSHPAPCPPPSAQLEHGAARLSRVRWVLRGDSSAAGRGHPGSCPWERAHAGSGHLESAAGEGTEVGSAPRTVSARGSHSSRSHSRGTSSRTWFLPWSWGALPEGGARVVRAQQGTVGPRRQGNT